MIQTIDQTIYQTFLQQVEQHPSKAALVVGARTLSYRQLNRQVVQVASYLLGQGVQTGDHIGILLPNSIEYGVLMIVAARLGLVIVPHNMSLSPSALARVFKSADVSHCIVWHARVGELRQNADFEASVRGLWMSVGAPVTGCTFFDDALADTAPDGTAPDVDITAPYILTMTSGSTGDPKPIELSQQTKIARARSAIELYGLSGNDVTIAATPLYHSLAERLVLIPLLSGGTAVIMPNFSPRNWLDAVSENQVTFSILVSSQVKQLLDLLKANVAMPPSLRCLVSSSERLSDNYKRDIMNTLKCEFHECYGASEIAIATNLNASVAITKWKSVGKPVPSVQVEILSKLGELAAPGEEGEIICKTDMLFSGYYKRPGVTESTMWGEFFRTGDLGKKDTDGFLYFLGRDKETIITGGINIYPRDVEEVLLTHPMVSECAVVAYDDERLGEVAAAVLVADLSDRATLRDIRFLCARELADYQQPRKFFLMKELPRNPMGKVMKRQVAEDIKQFEPVMSR